MKFKWKMFFHFVVTSFLRDKESHTSLFAILESFGSCSGQDKTEIIALGSNILHEKDFNDYTARFVKLSRSLEFILVMTKNGEMI